MKKIFLRELEEYSELELLNRLGSEVFEGIKEKLYERNILFKKNRNYKLRYVGIILYKKMLISVLPKIDAVEDKISQRDYTNLILNVLDKYRKNPNVRLVEEEMETLLEFGTRESENLLSLVDFLFRDYMEYGLFYSEKTVKKITDGEIDWEYTINKTLPLYVGTKFIYLETYSKQKNLEDENLIRKLHMIILNECSKYIKELKFFDIFKQYPDLDFNVEVDELYENDFLLYELEKELRVEFKDRNVRLLKALKAFLERKGDFSKEKEVLFYGVRKFETVWENICSEIIGNQMKKLEIERKMIRESSPSWYYKNNPKPQIFEKQHYIPDIIVKKGLKLRICDAKYYNIQITGGKYSGIPKMKDVSKQFLYENVLEKYYTSEKICNIFLFPYSQENFYSYAGKIEMSLFQNKHINIILMDFKRSLDKYIKKIK